MRDTRKERLQVATTQLTSHDLLGVNKPVLAKYQDGVYELYSWQVKCVGKHSFKTNSEERRKPIFSTQRLAPEVVLRLD